MPFVALDETGARVCIADYSRMHVLEKMKDLTYRCPACSSQMLVICGERKTPHFRHQPDCTCTHEGASMTKEHLEYQMLARDFCRDELGLANVEMEVPLGETSKGKRRIVDVLVGLVDSSRGASVALEIQLSGIEIYDLRQRTEDYFEKGVGCVIWFFESHSRIEKLREVMNYCRKPLFFEHVSVLKHRFDPNRQHLGATILKHAAFGSTGDYVVNDPCQRSIDVFGHSQCAYLFEPYAPIKVLANSPKLLWFSTVKDSKLKESKPLPMDPWPSSFKKYPTDQLRVRPGVDEDVRTDQFRVRPGVDEDVRFEYEIAQDRLEFAYAKLECANKVLQQKIELLQQQLREASSE